MADKNGALREVNLSDIQENPVALRGVDKSTADYAGLVESIKLKGVLNPILLREFGKNPETGKMVYAVTDGLQRFSASLDAGKKTIPAYIKNMEESEVWEAQIIANAVRIETHPHEFAKQLYRIFTQNPMMTASELSTRLGKSPEWISRMLGLIRIKDERIASLINQGKITVSNAYALSKLPIEEHANWIDRAMTQSPAEFIPSAEQRVKEIRDAKRKGKDVAPEQFVALPTLRRLKDLKEERDNLKVGPQLLKQLNVEDKLEAWKTALDWVLNLDPNSLEVRKQKEQERKDLAKQKAQELKKEKEELRKKEAAEKMAQLTSSEK